MGQGDEDFCAEFDTHLTYSSIIVELLRKVKWQATPVMRPPGYPLRPLRVHLRGERGGRLSSHSRALWVVKRVFTQGAWDPRAEDLHLDRRAWC